MNDKFTRLENLIAMKKEGLVDDYEFKQMKKEILEDKKIQFTGSGSKACKLSMNKCEAKKVWRELSLPTPDFVEIINNLFSNLFNSYDSKEGINAFLNKRSPKFKGK